MIPETPAPAPLCVSLVTYRSDLGTLQRTLNCLGAGLQAARQAGAVDHVAICLVDNASGDAYRSKLEVIFEAVSQQAPAWQYWTLHCSDLNPGFGVAHNSAQAPYSAARILILNPDVELTDEALVEGLAYLAAHPATVALNPRSQRADASPEYLCKRYPSVLDLFLRGFAGAALQARFVERLAHYEYRDRDPSLPASVELLSGACLLLRGDAFREVGGFDERFFLYFEDFDLSRRLARLGTLSYAPAMRVTHHGGGAGRKGWQHRRWFVASALRFFQKHGWRLR